jgi:hypothetical protein
VAKFVSFVCGCGVMRGTGEEIEGGVEREGKGLRGNVKEGGKGCGE